MKTIFIAMAQSLYSYGIGTWGGAYNTHLNLLEITINSLKGRHTAFDSDEKHVMREPNLWEQYPL